jgi:hypothetical protein
VQTLKLLVKNPRNDDKTPIDQPGSTTVTTHQSSGPEEVVQDLQDFVHHCLAEAPKIMSGLVMPSRFGILISGCACFPFYL